MSTDYTEFESKMKKTASVLTEQYDSVRAGKANPAVLDRITVDYYGSPTPIQQIASVSTPDARSAAHPAVGHSPDLPAADRGGAERSSSSRQKVRRGRPRSPSATSAAMRWRTFKKKKGQRADRGRSEDRREGPAEAHRRYVQGAGRPLLEKKEKELMEV